MAANATVRCSNCWRSIALDAANCPFCGFVFGEGKVGAAFQRMQRAEPAIEPANSVASSRLKSGLLTAGGFALCLGVLDLLAEFIPFLGLLFFGAVAFASPFAWGWTLLAGRDAPWPIDPAYVPWALVAPFPVVGFIVGLIWPLSMRSWTQVLNAAGMRFALSLGALVLLGVGAFMLTLPA
jgi:hypothetical protein